jgi:plasmid stabilization system protein ParE
MARAVGFHPEAIEEALSAREWYEERSLSASVAFMADLDAAVASISDAPERWPLFLYGTRRYPFRRFPYFLVYRDNGDVVQVVAVAHARRRPGYWRLRESSG